ncbi:MAG: CBS domain-containing protein [Bacteroidetes bacterium]|nr:MAG: CBS domain-containing protein [Bacteroidota bacterium]
MMNERLSAIMTTDVVTVNPKDKLTKVKDILFSRGFHHIPVVEGKKLVGIVTTYDLLKQNRRFEEYDDLLVEDIMTRKVVTLRPNELVGAAAQIFLKHLFHGLPIVNDDRELVGIVTTHDIMKYQFLKEYPNDEFIKRTGWLEKVKI